MLSKLFHVCEYCGDSLEVFVDRPAQCVCGKRYMVKDTGRRETSYKGYLPYELLDD